MAQNGSSKIRQKHDRNLMEISPIILVKSFTVMDSVIKDAPTTSLMHFLSFFMLEKWGKYLLAAGQCMGGNCGST